MEIGPQITKEEFRERAEHRDAILDIRAMLNSESGRRFFKYLFKNFDVGSLPERGMDGEILHEYLGFLRAGNSIFKLASEANVEIAAQLLAKIEKERYADLYPEPETEA